MSESSKKTEPLNRQSGDRDKVWLPEIVYESLPYLYLLAGFGALFTSLYITEWYWVLPHCLLVTAVGTHAGVSILLKRLRARAGRNATAAQT
ncbi:MAG: hypothetical protein AAFR91_11355 [Pseudomonadota bacterium]